MGGNQYQIVQEEKKKKKKGFARAKKNCTQKMRKLFAASPMCHNTALL